MSLEIQWVRLCTSTAEEVGSIFGQVTKSPYALAQIFFLIV